MFILVGAVLACSAAGCTVTQQVDTHILDAQLNGQPTPIPVHVTTPQTSNSTTVTPSLSLRATRRLTGQVEGSPVSDGIPFYPSGQVPDHNLTWNFPVAAAGIELDIARQSTAFTLAGNVTAGSGTSTYGFLAGFGMFSHEPGGMAARFDIGATFQAITGRIASVEITTTHTTPLFGSPYTTVDTAFYVDTQTKLRLGYFASLTLNTASEESPVNLVFQATYQYQSLFGFTPSRRVTRDWTNPILVPATTQNSGVDVSTTVSFFSVAPALAVRFGPMTRLVVGARISWPVMEDPPTPTTIVQPFIRMDMRLN
jgi:hypothetical protein